jgi:prolyl oligopeptidase PreP (S9A serine peptidase family)
MALLLPALFPISAMAGIFCSAVFTTSMRPQLGTASKTYQDIEQSSETLEKIESAANRNLNQSLTHGKTYESLRETFKRIFDVVKERKVIEVPAQDSGVYLITRGLGKPTDLVWRSNKTRQDRLIFSNASLGNTVRNRFLKAVSDRSASRAALVFAQDGSTDSFDIRIVDLKSGQILKELLASSTDVAWYNEGLLFKDENSKIRLARSSGRVKEYSSMTYFSPPVNHSTYYIWDGHAFIHGPSGTVDLSWFGPLGKSTKLIRNSDQLIVLHVPSNSTGSAVRIIKKDPQGQLSLFKDIQSLPNEDIENAFADDENVYLHVYQGPSQVIRQISLRTGQTREVDLPSFVSPIGVSSKGSTIQFNFASILKASVKADFDVNKMEFVQPLEELALKDGDLELVSEVRTGQSADGTTIFFQSYHKKEASVKGAFIESYGGFNHTGYFYPLYQAQLRPFLAAGGAYVGPLVRGDAEFGKDWSNQAKTTGKHKTFEDLRAVSQALQRQMNIPVEHIALYGASNGGFTAAATTLLFPQDFGLAIPLNGVLDLLGKERLDPEYGNGWSYEYGNSSQFKDYMQGLSPLELSQRPGRIPSFLILNGLDDSRVNMFHSYKLYQSLLDAHPDQADQIRMLSINNGGHWSASVNYQNLIGWRTQVILWTTVFEKMNMEN